MSVIPGESMARHLARVAAEAVAGQAPGTCTLPRSLPECGQCQAAARPAAQAALSFSGLVSQVTTAASAPGRQQAATGTGRRPGGPRH
jgi:hypothetical protein